MTIDSPSSPTTLCCRLLCADANAYGIGPGDVLRPQEPYYSHAGFLQPPRVLVTGVDGINAALVGVFTEGILVAFRGTLPPETLTLPVVLDWLQSFSLKPAASTVFPGAVHGGFLEAFVSVWPLVESAVSELRSEYPDQPLHVTGHSKGGAMATFAAWQLTRSGLRPASVVTFASPRPGDAAFAAAYTALGLAHRRYENYLDAVPFYPPDFDSLDPLRALPGWSAQHDAAAEWDYAPVGELHYIAEDGSVVGDSPDLHHRRVREIVSALLEGHASRVAGAHSLVPTLPASAGATDAPLVYLRGVCPDLQPLSRI